MAFLLSFQENLLYQWLNLLYKFNNETYGKSTRFPFTHMNRRLSSAPAQIPFYAPSQDTITYYQTSKMTLQDVPLPPPPDRVCVVIKDNR